MGAALVRDPIYRQLNDALRGLLRSGGYAAGDRFLTEREIAERFRVSRVTANKALSNLISEGVLEFRRGVGTFVRDAVLDYDLRSLVSFTRKAAAAGRRPATRVLSFQSLPASRLPADVAAALALAPSDPVHAMHRLRLADGLPVILERRFVPASFCPGLRRADLAGSLYALWTGRYRLELSGAEESIRAVNLKGEDASLLRVRPGAAGLAVTAVGRVSDGRPLWWERTLYRADAYEFRNRVGRPAVGTLLRRTP